MVARSRVAAHADVPVIGCGAEAGGRLAGRCRSGVSVIQRDQVLLVQGPRAAAANGDVVITVLPEHIVGQKWVRDLLAIRVGGSRARKMAWRAGDCWQSVHSRKQLRAVLDGDQTGRLRRRSRDAGHRGSGRARAVWTWPLAAG